MEKLRALKCARTDPVVMELLVRQRATEIAGALGFVNRGLLGLKVGDSTEIKIPAGVLKYKVLKISLIVFITPCFIICYDVVIFCKQWYTVDRVVNKMMCGGSFGKRSRYPR